MQLKCSCQLYPGTVCASSAASFAQTDSLRKFYASLHRQNPDSLMAKKWCALLLQGALLGYITTCKSTTQLTQSHACHCPPHAAQLPGIRARSMMPSTLPCAGCWRMGCLRRMKPCRRRSSWLPPRGSSTPSDLLPATHTLSSANTLQHCQLESGWSCVSPQGASHSACLVFCKRADALVMEAELHTTVGQWQAQHAVVWRTLLLIACPLSSKLKSGSA